LDNDYDSNSDSQNIALKRLTVLIVDDTQNVLKALHRQLSSSFNKVLTAQNVKDAEELLSLNRVDYLVCDLKLNIGEPNGFVLVPKWRNEYPSIQKAVIFTSAVSEPNRVPEHVNAVLNKTDGAEGILETFLSRDSSF